MLSIRDFELDSDAGDLHSVASEQRRELMAAQALDSDLDFAFNLQLQEALSASLSLQNLPSSSSAASPAPQLNLTETKDDVSTFAQIQSDEILKLEQELKDQTISESEFRKLKDDLRRRIHDRKVALDISRISDEEWQDWGDNYERPFGEGSSKGANDEVFKIYFKGLVERQLKNGALLGGIGVAICDSRDDLLFELRKPLIVNGLSRKSAEFMALIEGLNAALALELERVTFYCDYYPTYNFINGRWSPKQKKVMSLVNKVSQLRDKFIYSQPSLVPRNDIKFAFKFAKEAILSQLRKPAESSGSRVLYETCVICLEDKDVSQIFSIDNCMHRYCRSCMKQHVEVKLLHGMLPMCPHEGCKSELKIDSCSKILTTRLIEIMTQRLKEASIPVTEKVYCPYPKCSALMSKKEVLNYSKSAILRAEISGARKCMKCNGQFCINCKVPWHINMTCFEYKTTNPFPQLEEVRLKNLAASNLWRQCVKCNHMIELAAGCYHMTCRCGYQFCYTCGAEWRNKKATCSCPLWDEENILEEEEEEEEDYDYEDEDEEYYDSDSDEYI